MDMHFREFRTPKNVVGKPVFTHFRNNTLLSLSFSQLPPPLPALKLSLVKYVHLIVWFL